MNIPRLGIELEHAPQPCFKIDVCQAINAVTVVPLCNDDAKHGQLLVGDDVCMQR